MDTSTAIAAHGVARLVRKSTAVACVFFIPATALMPGPGSSLGMPWEVFFCTWGVTIASALVAVIGFISCKTRHIAIGTFYIICPVMLLLSVVFVALLRNLVHALLP